ncbi:sensor histidine kinase [Sulfidibacter corallicola]|uniref:histidine kinase n=1 Tax=Sulfidibacter corallicola TaxID=2818388 RepID=A0A8A4TNQ8_SULCO|nr:ATP-binding protein [Sulfidibacter corallicola]QTD50578.1 hypothetical protein J3U87_33760 [Sulfidibacter corallicola]
MSEKDGSVVSTQESSGEPIGHEVPQNLRLDPLAEFPASFLELFAEALVIFGPDGKVCLANRLGERLMAGRPSLERQARLDVHPIATRCEGVDSDWVLCEWREPWIRQDLVPVWGDPWTHLAVCRRESALRWIAFVRARLAPQSTGEGGDVEIWRDRARRAERRLIQVQKEKEEFAYLAAHDLNEPLRKIVSYLELLVGRWGPNLDDDSRGFLEIVSNGVERLQTMIRDLRAYSRLGFSQIVPNTDLNETLSRALAELETEIHRSGAVLDTEPLPVAPCDGDHMGRVFFLLLDNALKFVADRKPAISIRAGEKGDCWRIAISDNGIGLGSSCHERIFKPFKRLHDRYKYPGNGMGLAICKKIVEQHGGRIGVESTLGQGATFWFTLPKSVSAASQDREPS